MVPPILFVAILLVATYDAGRGEPETTRKSFRDIVCFATTCSYVPFRQPATNGGDPLVIPYDLLWMRAKTLLALCASFLNVVLFAKARH